MTCDICGYHLDDEDDTTFIPDKKGQEELAVCDECYQDYLEKSRE